LTLNRILLLRHLFGRYSKSVWPDCQRIIPVITFTFNEYIKIKRIVLDRDAQGALDFMKMIDKRCEHIVTRQGSLKNTINA